MNSAILEAIGIDPAFIFIGMLVLVIILFVLLMVNQSKLKKLEKKYEAFMSGADGESLEKSILGRFEEVDMLKSENEIKTKVIQDIREQLKTAYQKSGFVKYDAFKEMGGKLSYVVAFLNEENTGVLINTMHSSHGCYSYMKEIIKGESFVALSEEEKQALEHAVKQNDLI